MDGQQSRDASSLLRPLRSCSQSRSRSWSWSQSRSQSWSPEKARHPRSRHSAVHMRTPTPCHTPPCREEQHPCCPAPDGLDPEPSPQTPGRDLDSPLHPGPGALFLRLCPGSQLQGRLRARSSLPLRGTPHCLAGSSRSECACLSAPPEKQDACSPLRAAPLKSSLTNSKQVKQLGSQRATCVAPPGELVGTVWKLLAANLKQL